MPSVFMLVLITGEDSVDDGIKVLTGDASRVDKTVLVVFDVSCCDPHFTLKFPLFPSEITETRTFTLMQIIKYCCFFQLYINSISISKVVFNL